MRCRTPLLGLLLVAIVAGPAAAEPRRLSPADLQSLGVRVEGSVAAVVASTPSSVAPPALQPVQKPAAAAVRPQPRPILLVPEPRPLPLIPAARPASIVSAPLPLDEARLQAVALKPAGAEPERPRAGPEPGPPVAVAPTTPSAVSVPAEAPKKLDADALVAVGLGARGRTSGAAP